MKKFLVSILMFLLVSFTSLGLAFATYTTTLTLHDGYAEYVSGDPGYAWGYVYYEFDWDLPPWDQTCNWTLDVDLWAEITVPLGQGETTYGVTWVDTFDIGRFALSDCEDEILWMYNNVYNTLFEFEVDGNDAGFTMQGDLQSGMFAAYIYTDMDNFEMVFGGDISANAAVPEPATMLLLGSGLIGLAGLGRKKFFKKS